MTTNHWFPLFHTSITKAHVCHHVPSGDTSWLQDDCEEIKAPECPAGYVEILAVKQQEGSRLNLVEQVWFHAFKKTLPCTCRFVRPPLIILSVDGFRASYVKRGNTVIPHIEKLSKFCKTWAFGSEMRREQFPWHWWTSSDRLCFCLRICFAVFLRNMWNPCTVHETCLPHENLPQPLLAGYSKSWQTCVSVLLSPSLGCCNKICLSHRVTRK